VEMKPPNAGASNGVKVIEIIKSDMRRTTSPPAALSRTMARPNTSEPQAPSDCSSLAASQRP
jgi:hypothetical protein